MGKNGANGKTKSLKVKVDLAGRYFVAPPHGVIGDPLLPPPTTGCVVGRVSGDTWLVEFDASGEGPARFHLVSLDLMHGWDFYDDAEHAVASVSTPGFVAPSSTSASR